MRKFDGRCHICGAVLGKDYNDICAKHSEDEIRYYYDAIEER